MRLKAAVREKAQPANVPVTEGAQGPAQPQPLLVPAGSNLAGTRAHLGSPSRLNQSIRLEAGNKRPVEDSPADSRDTKRACLATTMSAALATAVETRTPLGKPQDAAVSAATITMKKGAKKAVDSS